MYLSLTHIDLRVRLSWTQIFYLLFNSRYNAVTVLNYSEAECFCPTLQETQQFPVKHKKLSGEKMLPL